MTKAQTNALLTKTAHFVTFREHYHLDPFPHTCAGDEANSLASLRPNPSTSLSRRGLLISTIRSIDLRLVDDLVNFVRGPGYVLDFSDSSFAAFFTSELDVDINDPVYAQQGRSKGKRLRYFLQVVDDATAIRTLRALWKHRVEILDRIGLTDPVPNAEGRLLSLITRMGDAETLHNSVSPQPANDLRLLAGLCGELGKVHTLPPQARGYAFEAFLKHCFDAAGLKARDAFRNVGEQIDGSFLLGNETYLLEAKWHASPTGVGDLHAFHGKLEQKAAWARGLFVSYNGFTAEGLAAFGRGKRLICMDGRDLHDSLYNQILLRDVLERKVRRAAETGLPYIPVRELFDLQGLESVR